VLSMIGGRKKVEWFWASSRLYARDRYADLEFGGHLITECSRASLRVPCAFRRTSTTMVTSGR